MNKFYLFLGVSIAVVVCIYVGVKKVRSIPPVDKIEFASVHPALADTQPVEDCQSKKTCFIVYVAPWCGACQMFMERHFSPMSNKIAQKDLGLLVIVGADAPAKNSDHAKKIGPLASTDTNDEFLKKNKIEYFPFFIVTSAGHVTHHGRPALDWLNEKMSER